jgi:hypothetical protein
MCLLRYKILVKNFIFHSAVEWQHVAWKYWYRCRFVSYLTTLLQLHKYQSLECNSKINENCIYSLLLWEFSVKYQRNIWRIFVSYFFSRNVIMQRN